MSGVGTEQKHVVMKNCELLYEDDAAAARPPSSVFMECTAAQGGGTTRVNGSSNPVTMCSFGA
jgi:hypothetical protein